MAARARPDHPAMIFGAERFTYADVDAAHGRDRARPAASRGIGPGDVVGLWMPRGFDLLMSADRHHQVRRGLAAVRCRRAGRAHRGLPWRCRGQGPPHHRSVRPAAPSMPLPAPHARQSRSTRPTAARSMRARRADAGSSRLPDLHVRLDRHAQGHRHQPSQHLPLPALRQRGLRLPARRRGVPGRFRRVRSLDGGDLGALSGRRDACSSPARR